MHDLLMAAEPVTTNLLCSSVFLILQTFEPQHANQSSVVQCRPTCVVDAELALAGLSEKIFGECSTKPV